MKKSETAISHKEIKGLAKNYSVLNGKWILYYDTLREAENHWVKIATALAGQKCQVWNRAVFCGNSENDYRICVYNQDHTEYGEIQRSEQALRELGIKIDIQNICL